MVIYIILFQELHFEVSNKYGTTMFTNDNSVKEK